MSAWYNENDPKAAAWLRELIKRGLIADGVVDGRSIEDITPAELAEFTQCHFFAGIGAWSYALRLAHWPDDRRVWTGSCPCQPLSQAGKGLGFADERHFWPAWEHLIRERRPPVLFGEQVASKAADAWADLVQDDLEALDYAFGAVPFPAASVGAPHIRDRLYWCATADNAEPGRQSRGRIPESRDGRGAPRVEFGRLRDARELAHYDGGRDAGTLSGAQSRAERCLRGELDFTQPSGRVGDDHDPGLEGQGLPAGERRSERSPWEASDFVWCRDGKWRPVEPGTFPLVNGAPERVGRLRGYGNAIVAQAAKVFVEESGLL